MSALMEGLRERKKRQTQEAIAGAAMELFLEHGFDAVTVADVARAADVAEKTVFNHFPTKEDLVFFRSDDRLAARGAGRRHTHPRPRHLDQPGLRGAHAGAPRAHRVRPVRADDDPSAARPGKSGPPEPVAQLLGAGGPRADPGGERGL